LDSSTTIDREKSAKVTYRPRLFWLNTFSRIGAEMISVVENLVPFGYSPRSAPLKSRRKACVVTCWAGTSRYAAVAMIT
jgi:hypothetical protein